MAARYYRMRILLREEERRIRRKEAQMHLRSNAFQLADENFIQLYRLPKELVVVLCSSLRSELESNSFRKNVLSVEIKVLAALRFFASGLYQMPVAQDITVRICQTSVSRCIRLVSKAINKVLLHQWIRFPTREVELTLMKRKFMNLGHFPGVIGAIDCTHIPIIAPSINDPIHKEFAYVNRKGYHSINVQLVCDADMRIININAKFPGSAHDSYIWKASKLRQAFLEKKIETLNNSWLIGDSGYPLEPWLMTPILEAEQPNEEYYNNCHSATRIIIERCNGVLKGRFRCLHKHRVLNYHPDMAALIINACAVLHNMCIENKVSFNNVFDDDDNENNCNHNSSILSSLEVENESQQSLLNQGKKIQMNLLRLNFSK